MPSIFEKDRTSVYKDEDGSHVVYYQDAAGTRTILAIPAEVAFEALLAVGNDRKPAAKKAPKRKPALERFEDGA